MTVKRLLGPVLVVAGVASGCGDESPYFESVLFPAKTVYDTVGPYLIEAYVCAPRKVDRLTLRVTEDPRDRRFADAHFRLAEGDRRQGRWVVSLPGRPSGSCYAFYVVLIDNPGAPPEQQEAVHDPVGAPDVPHCFRIFAPGEEPKTLCDSCVMARGS